MNALLFIGGKAPQRFFIENYFSEASFIIAADSGLDHLLSYGLSPDIVVGDMDSLKDPSVLNSFDREAMHFYPQEKDETDTEIGVRVAQENGYSSLIMIGGGGGRLDHILGILRIFERAFHPEIWFTHREEVRLIETSLKIEGREGQIISFFPMGVSECRMESKGLKWPLNGLRWKRGDVGISNRLSASEAFITMKSGKLLMIKELSGE